MPTFNAQQRGRIERGLSNVFLQGGERLTWYRFVAESGGAPWAGIGPSITYATAQTWGITKQWDVEEVQAAGGRIESGSVPLLMREQLARRDRIGYRGNVYDVANDPEPASLNGIILYRVILTRAGA